MPVVAGMVTAGFQCNGKPVIARSLEKSQIEWVSVRHEEAGVFAAQAARDQMRRPALDLHGNGAGPPAGQKSLSAVDLDETPRARLIAYGVAVLAMVLSLLIRWPLWPVLHDAVPH